MPWPPLPLLTTALPESRGGVDWGRVGASGRCGLALVCAAGAEAAVKAGSVRRLGGLRGARKLRALCGSHGVSIPASPKPAVTNMRDTCVIHA